MWQLDKYMMAFFLILVIVMGYLLMGERPEAAPTGRINQPVPEFALTDLSEKNTYHADALKNGWTLLNIWASWCAPCKQEHAYLYKLSRQGYRIVGVDFKDKASDAQAFLDERGNPYAVVLYDRDGKLGFDLGAFGVPETLLIDEQGIVRHRYVGVLTPEIFKKQFMPLMQED